MDKLIPYIQEEFATYRRDCKVLGTRYPGLPNRPASPRTGAATRKSSA